ncbi:unnamed protein product [Caenorhabditis auriculariae]|uniref:Uncharacterized protein n=1 Tax=Caenorhabditis auriculariae TaxID=2777116 RepID=A0A8S1GWA0_9PELO|nr:unnamed protein product [Caenorhabditis auriculariae]
MDLLTGVVPVLVRQAALKHFSNSLYQQLEHVHLGILPTGVLGLHPVTTLYNGNTFSASASEVRHTTSYKCQIDFQNTEELKVDLGVLKTKFEDQPNFTFGKTKDNKQYFVIAALKDVQKEVSIEDLLFTCGALLAIKHDLRHKEILQIAKVQLPIVITESFTVCLNFPSADNTEIDIFDENMTHCGSIRGIEYKQTIA